MKWLSWCLLLLILLACLGMKKTSDEELNQWRYDQKRAPVSLGILGDPAIAYSHMGEAKSLLWSVKNALNLNKQMQGEGERRLRDGTTIRVKCVFGLDIVKIDASKSTLAPEAVLLPPSCTITFINFPISVPPMRNPDVIAPTDVQGVDYFKSYYSFDVENCPDCKDISWDLTFNYALPFESRHYHNDGKIRQMGVDPGEDDPNNHTVYSIYPACWAQIISHGQDAGGTYIIWKAYTEAGSTPVFSRTGLGILLISAFILDSSETTICSQQAKLDVDCCQKNPDLRKVEIWWEDFGTCNPFIPYKGVLYNSICKMPTDIPMGGTIGLIWYACTSPGQPFYAIPEINGGCLPLEWSVGGPIGLVSDKHSSIVFIKCLPFGCNDAATITLKDRCGGEYSIRTRPCCSDAAPLQITYTSLQMSCGGKQSFGALGGCAPYVWRCNTGVIDQGGNYTAPSSNGDCLNNDVVTVTDCCGNEASCQIAINCYDNVSTAIVSSQCNVCSRWCLGAGQAGCNQGAVLCLDLVVDVFNCSGVSLSHCTTSHGCADYTDAPCNGNTTNWRPASGAEVPGCDTTGDCSSAQCGGGACGVVDGRSPTMKSGGCCPINPYTGLPL